MIKLMTYALEEEHLWIVKSIHKANTADAFVLGHQRMSIKNLTLDNRCIYNELNNRLLL